jgi:hypothetical protein
MAAAGRSGTLRVVGCEVRRILHLHLVSILISSHPSLQPSNTLPPSLTSSSCSHPDIDIGIARDQHLALDGQ